MKSESKIVSREVAGSTGEKLDNPGDLEKSVKTERLSVVLIHLLGPYSRNLFLKKVRKIETKTLK